MNKRLVTGAALTGAGIVGGMGYLRHRKKKKARLEQSVRLATNMDRVRSLAARTGGKYHPPDKMHHLPQIEYSKKKKRYHPVKHI